MQFILSLSRIWQFYSINFRICGIVELYSIVYGEIMFLNDNQYFYVYLYWGKCPLGHIRPPPLANHYTKFVFKFFYLYFSF